MILLWLKAVPARIWADIVLVLALCGLLAYGAMSAYDWAYGKGVDAEHKLREADRVAHEAALAAAKAKGAQDTADLQRKADDDRTAYNSQMAVLGATVGTLSARVQRDATARPTSGPNVPGAAGAGQSACRTTGAGLYREDQQFLVGELAATQTLASALRQCYAAYDRAREKSLTAPSQ